MTIVVTGADGFLGSKLLNRLAQSHDIVIPTTRWGGANLEDETAVKRLMARYNPDVIYHLAANPRPNYSSPGMTHDNVLSTHNLLNYAKPGCKFVLASSVAVYGQPIGGFHCENHPLYPSTVYGASKVGAEALVLAYTQQERVVGVSLRFVNIVGPGMTHGVLKDIIYKLRSDEPELELLGYEPGSNRKYIHSDDAVSALIATAGLVWPINVSSGGRMSTKEVAELAMHILGIHKPIKWLGNKSKWAGDRELGEVSTLRMSVLPKFRFRTSVDAVRYALEQEKGL